MFKNRVEEMDLMSWGILFHNFSVAKENAIYYFCDRFLQLWICSLNVFVVHCCYIQHMSIVDYDVVSQ